MLCTRATKATPHNGGGRQDTRISVTRTWSSPLRFCTQVPHSHTSVAAGDTSCFLPLCHETAASHHQATYRTFPTRQCNDVPKKGPNPVVFEIQSFCATSLLFPFVPAALEIYSPWPSRLMPPRVFFSHLSRNIHVRAMQLHDGDSCGEAAVWQRAVPSTHRMSPILRAKSLH